METRTAREFNQQSARVLGEVEQGKSIAVTKNGRHIATLTPAGASEREQVRPFPVDAMGDEDDLPVFHGPADFSSRAEEMPADGFGE